MDRNGGDITDKQLRIALALVKKSSSHSGWDARWLSGVAIVFWVSILDATGHEAAF